MFNREPETAARPFSSRLGGIALGSVIMVGVTGMLISSRTTPFYLLVLVIMAAGMTDWRRFVAERSYCPGPLLFAALMLIGYVALSALWARQPAAALEKAALATALILGTSIIVIAIDQRDRIEHLHIAEGLWLGLAFGLTFTLFEAFTGQAIVRAIVNLFGLGPGSLRPAGYYVFSDDGTLVSVRQIAMARNITPITLLLWPALAALHGYLTGRIRRVITIVILVAASVAIMTSVHETSKMALILGGLAWLLAYNAPRIVGPVIRASWLAACLLPIPIAMILYNAKLHEASWVQTSARHRIEIWNASAQEALISPVFGKGAMSTYVTNSVLPRTESNRLRPPHQHNVYLQVWFELGLVGALLLAFLGWRALDVISNVDSIRRPYAYALMASAASIAASSYGIWQVWFMGMFSMAVVAFSIAAKSHRGLGKADA